MSKDLIDVDAFTSPVHVPEGLDDRDDAAGDVERLGQALANRTRYLQSRVDSLVTDAARRSQDNVFAGVNSFAKSLVGTMPTADLGFLFTNSSPVALGTSWRVIASFAYAAGLYVRMYTGKNSADNDGAFLIATNAEYDFAATPPSFHQNNPAHDSSAVIWHRGRVRVSRVAAGAAAWENWPVGFAAGLIAPSTVVSAYVEGEYLYSSPKSRPIHVPVLSAFGETMIRDTGTGYLRTSDLANPLTWPIRPPPGGVLVETTLLVNQTTSANGTLKLYEVVTDYNSPFTVTRTVVKTKVTTGGAGLKWASDVWDNRPVNPEAYYEVEWKPGSVADDVRGHRMFVLDPGPRSS